MRGFVVGTLALLTIAPHAYAQVRLLPGPEVHVAAIPGVDIVEAHLSVSPVDGRHLVGAAMVVRAPDFSAIDCTIVASFDGGVTWTRHDLGLPKCGDPWTLITEAGTPLVAVLGVRTLLVYRSSDGGHTWPAEPVRLDGPHDHEMMTGGGDGEPIYVVSGLARRAADGAQRSAIFVARSIDDGLSFEPVSEVVLSNLSYEAMTPVLAGDGALLVPFQDHHRFGGGRVASRRSWLLSFDSTGQSGAPRLIDEGCNRVGPVGWPTLTILHRNEGERLVWACEREEAEGIAVRISDDSGETWREGPTLSAPGDTTWTKVPSLAASEQGALVASWTQGDGGRAGCRRFLGAVSRGGGESFSAPLELSTVPACPGDSAVWSRFPAGGDYAGLVAVGDSAFQVLWADGRSGRFELYSRRVRIGR